MNFYACRQATGQIAVLGLPPLTFGLTYHNDSFMARQLPGKSVAQFRPRPDQLRETIRRISADSKDVAFGAHALERMEEREITTLDALRVLRTGNIVGDIEPGKNSGEWKCKVVAGRRGSREIGVATVVLAKGRLFIKTVEWEDL